MNSFRQKENGVWEDIMKLIDDTTDDVMGKAVDLYTEDEELQKRASEEKLLDISFECMLLLAHVLDVVLMNRRPDIRVSIMRSVYRVISEVYHLNEIDQNTPFQSEEIIEDRMQRYGMIVRGEWKPSASWWFGAELKKDIIIQCLALCGDYITFFRVFKKIPLDDDIEPIILVNPLDCETLAVPFIVFQILAPAVTLFTENLDKIIQGVKDGPEITFSADMKKAKDKENLIVGKETGEVIGKRRISEISGEKKPSNNSKTAIAVIASACVILVICMIWISSVLSRFPSPVHDSPTLSAEPEPTSEPTPTPTPAPTSKPTPSPKPTSTPFPDLMPRYVSNGTILLEPVSEMLAPLTVEASEDVNYYILLNPINPPSNSNLSTLDERIARMKLANSRMSFYVSAGNTAEVSVPLGEYEIYYATGKTWYGPEEKFGSATQFYKCDDTFDFYDDGESYIGWTLTLYKVSNGNMDTTPISEGEFPVF